MMVEQEFAHALRDVLFARRTSLVFPTSWIRMVVCFPGEHTGLKQRVVGSIEAGMVLGDTAQDIRATMMVPVRLTVALWAVDPVIPESVDSQVATGDLCIPGIAPRLLRARY